MKKILATTTALALTATAAMAEPLTTWQADNYVKSVNKNIGGSTWGAGLLVKVDGEKTFYRVGEAGVTSDMVFSDYDAAVAWAENLTGENIRAVGKQRNHTEVEERTVGHCPPKTIKVRVAHQDLVWR